MRILKLQVRVIHQNKWYGKMNIHLAIVTILSWLPNWTLDMCHCVPPLSFFVLCGAWLVLGAFRKKKKRSFKFYPWPVWPTGRMSERASYHMGFFFPLRTSTIIFWFNCLIDKILSEFQHDKLIVLVNHFFWWKIAWIKINFFWLLFIFRRFLEATWLISTAEH